MGSIEKSSDTSIEVLYKPTHFKKTRNVRVTEHPLLVKASIIRTPLISRNVLLFPRYCISRKTDRRLYQISLLKCRLEHGFTVIGITNLYIFSWSFSLARYLHVSFEIRGELTTPIRRQMKLRGESEHTKFN